MATAVKGVGKAGDAIIEPDEVVKSRRGRTAKTSEALITLLKALPEGKVMLLKGTFGEVPAGEERQKVSGEIRKNFKVAHEGRECTIDYTPTGVPQVRFKAVQAA